MVSSVQNYWLEQFGQSGGANGAYRAGGRYNSFQQLYQQQMGGQSSSAASGGLFPASMLNSLSEQAGQGGERVVDPYASYANGLPSSSPGYVWNQVNLAQGSYYSFPMGGPYQTSWNGDQSLGGQGYGGYQGGQYSTGTGHCPYCHATWGSSLASSAPAGENLYDFWNTYYNWGQSGQADQVGWTGDLDYLNELYGIGNVGATGSVDDPNQFTAQKVGEIDRAPMAMFEHQGDLVMSVISRNGISETPVYSYTPGESIVKASKLPEQMESGHYGYSTGDEFHLVTESNGGLVDYTAYDPEGPWYRHEYTDLVPHDYKNLTWGANYMDEESGRQFMGFGRGDNPGMVLTYEEGEWQVFAAPDDMRFPNSYGVINHGPEAGTVLIGSATYGRSVLHKVSPDGEVEKVKDFDAWGGITVHEDEGIAYFDSGEHVYWSNLDDLENWTEVKYKVDGEYQDKMETNGGAILHPTTGRMLFPASSESGRYMRVYEAHRDGDDVTLVSVAKIDGVGAWAAKSAVVGDDVYVGGGIYDGREADRVPGAIYKLELA